MTKKPVVCLPCNSMTANGMKGHVARDPYIRALTEVAGCAPILIPSIDNGIDPTDLIARVDGFLFTGARSHIAPEHYNAERTFTDDYLDTARDGTTLPLIKAAIAADKPVLAICRGFQELNVALGGTLHQHVHDLPGKNDHRGNADMPLPERYTHRAHTVRSSKGGIFEKIGLPENFSVNSIHQQGVDRLGAGLLIEAIAEDGLVEAVSLPGKRFVLGTQWHPEGEWEISPPAKAILTAFGDALRQ